jgi:type I restriction-modification system DNA methylase subunit
MVNPRLSEKVLDPACGTGGFLSCSIEHIRKQDVKTVDDEMHLQASIFGIEKKPMPHLLCTADLFLVLIMQLLKSGGRAALVLPDGFLFGEGIAIPNHAE